MLIHQSCGSGRLCAPPSLNRSYFVEYRHVFAHQLYRGYLLKNYFVHMFDFETNRTHVREPRDGRAYPTLQAAPRGMHHPVRAPLVPYARWCATLSACRGFPCTDASHPRAEISRRDDLESFLYALLEFYHGRLPWQGLPEPKWTSKTALVGDMKTTAPFHALLARSAPEFAAYHAHVAGLRYGERPDYALLRGLFRERKRTEGWAFDGNFDWMDAAGLEKGTLLPEEYVLSLDFVEEKEWNPHYM